MSRDLKNAVKRMKLAACLKTVLLWLADSADGKTGVCIFQNKMLAAETGYSVRSIIRITQKLCKLGLISKTNNGREMKYTLLFDRGGCLI